MAKLGISGRVALIVIASLIVVWIFSIGHYYRTRDVPGEGGRPSPKQIAAIAQLLEQGSSELVPLVLEAVNSESLVATLSASAVADPLPSDAVAVPTGVQAPYVALLDDRQTTIVSTPVSEAERRFPILFAPATNALEFRIALRNGKTLIIKTRSPVVLSRWGLPIGFGAGLAGTVIALIALLVMHRALRPLAKLAAVVDRIEPTGEVIALPRMRSSTPEVHALLGAFNRLQARVSQLLQARLALLGGISHDVRTFATRLRLRLDQIPDVAERDRAAADIDDMIRLLDDALLASRAGARELNEELVEIEGLLRAEVEDRAKAGHDVKLLTMPDCADVTMLGDRLALRRIASNLIDNALKFGRLARIELKCDGARVILTVDDNGPGIPHHLREAMLEPFARAEASRSRETGGAGLGLAIVRRLVEAHDGTIAIGDAPGGGARIIITLPVFLKKPEQEAS